MSLLDADEEQQDEVRFDEDSKIRLFETQQKNSKSIHDYVKHFLPFAVIVIVGLGVLYYFMQPGIGDEVRASNEMYDSVYDHMLTKEKRTATEMTFYKCDGYYWVKVLAEPRSYPPSLRLDPVNQYRLTARQQVDGKYQIVTLPLPSQNDDVPCKQQ
jgi:hypothetical protein